MRARKATKKDIFIDGILFFIWFILVANFIVRTFILGKKD